jgi:hypothetical protein
MHGVGVVDLFL